MNSFELARELVKQAEDAAERKYQAYVSETLPRELKRYAKSELKDYYRRRLQAFRDWHKDNFFLPFDPERFDRERLVSWLAALLRDAADGKKVRFTSHEHAVIMLSERMVNIRLIHHLVSLLDGAPSAAPSTETELDHLADLIRKVLETKGLLKDGKFAGDSTHVKALFNVLVKGGRISGPHKERRFAAFFLEHFDFRITGRTLQNPPNKGQQEAENAYSLLLP